MLVGVAVLAAMEENSLWLWGPGKGFHLMLIGDPAGFGAKPSLSGCDQVLSSVLDTDFDMRLGQIVAINLPEGLCDTKAPKMKANELYWSL